LAANFSFAQGCHRFAKQLQLKWQRRERSQVAIYGDSLLLCKAGVSVYGRGERFAQQLHSNFENERIKEPLQVNSPFYSFAHAIIMMKPEDKSCA